MAFPLLWCERCGHAGEPRLRGLLLPTFVATPTEPLRCEVCHEPLVLLSCETRGSLHKGRWCALLEDVVAAERR